MFVWQVWYNLYIQKIWLSTAKVQEEEITWEEEEN